MSADLLRKAATILRERAEAKGVPDGPWFVEDDGDRWNVLAPDPDMPGFPWDVARDVGGDEPDLPNYIATMHPGVGLALADWLDLVARLLSEGFDPNAETTAAVAVARVIVGDPS